MTEESNLSRDASEMLLRGTIGTNKRRKWWPHENGAGIKPLPPLLAQIGGKGLFNPQKRNFLNEPHHAGITKVEQIQGYNNV